MQYSHAFANIEHIYLYWLPKTVYFRVLESWTNHVLSCITGPILQDDVIANFQF